MSWPEIERLKRMLADNIRLCACSPAEPSPLCPDRPCLPRATKFLHSTPSVSLSEDGSNARLTQLCVTDVSPDGITLKLDVFGIHFFHANTLNKLCDYVILTEHDGQKYAVFIDLKSSLPRIPLSNQTLPIFDKEDLARAWQFNGGSLLFDYLSLGVALHDTCEQFLTDYEKCFFELYTRVIPPTSGKTLLTAPNSKVRDGKGRLRHTWILTKQVDDASTISVNELIHTWKESRGTSSVSRYLRIKS